MASLEAVAETMKTSDFLCQVIHDTGIIDAVDVNADDEQGQYLVLTESDGGDKPELGDDLGRVKLVKGRRGCPFCHAAFTIHLDLQKHMDLYHNEERKYVCDECGKRFHSHNALNLHIRSVHLDHKPHKCNICDGRFTSKASLARHTLIHTGAKPHKCSVCQKSFRMSYSLKEHERIHTGERPYECDFCEKSFTCVTDLRIHLRQHSGVQDFQCDICSKKFYSAKRLSAHRKRHEAALLKDDKVPMHKCSMCKHVFMEVANLSQHIRQHHSTKRGAKRQVAPVKRPTDFYCTHCRIYLATWHDLNRHVEVDHALFECRRCKKQFDSRDAVRLHVREQHALTDGVPCHLCERNFPNEDLLSVHLAAHAHFTCAHCSDTFNNAVTLKDHMIKAHNPEMMETCRICSQQFVSKQRLQRHLQCHAYPAPYKCPICRAGFNHDQTVTRHMDQVHNIVRNVVAPRSVADEPPKHFQMEYNGSTMTVVFEDPKTGMTDLKTMITSEEENIFKCAVCNNEFGDRESLNVHVNGHDTAEIVLSIVRRQGADTDEPLPKDIIVTRASKDTDTEDEETHNTDCLVCGEMFFTEADLQQHMHRHDEANKHTISDIEDEEQEDCVMEVPEANTVEDEHIVELNDDVEVVDQVEPAVRKFKSTRCRFCEKTLPTKGGWLPSDVDWIQHEKSHIDNMDFKCMQCNEEFLEGDDLLKHKEIHQKRRTRSYLCAHCGVTMEDVALMKQHMETHTQAMQILEQGQDTSRPDKNKENSKAAKRYSCQLCRFWFDSKLKLRRHLRVHREVKPHACATCGRGFGKLATLKYHAKSHTAVQPYGCSICSDKFDQAYRLTAHMTVHGHGRFQCNKCDLRFMSQSSFDRHSRAHRAATDLSCGVCDAKFLTGHALRQHIKREHCEGTEVSVNARDAADDKRVYWCIICSESFDKEDELIEHGASHLKCDHCALAFTDALEVECHLLDHHALENNICMSCGDNFEDSNTLWEHTLQKHVDSQTCLCEKCNKVCLSQRHLKIHLTSHPLTQEAEMHCDFFCNVCRLLFTTESFMNIHNERHKACTMCGDVSEDLTLHLLQNHSLPQVEKCYHCDRVLTDPDTRADHLNMHVIHPEVLERCADCENGFADVDGLIEHMKTGHSCDAAKCIICGMLCLGNDDLNDHLRTEHVVFDVQRCSQCSNIFMNATLDDMIKHAASHEPKVDLFCCVCEAKFGKEKLLKEHLQSHATLDNLFKCIECTKKFSRTKDFRKHVRNDHGVIAKVENCRLACGICNKVMKLESIGTHVKNHMASARRFSCSICPLTFNTKSSLGRHVLVHTDDRPAICDVCGNGFRNNDRLRQHQRHHTKDFPHKCTVKGCDKAFVLKTKLREHQTRKHGYDAPFRCIFCEAKFVYRRHLKNHMLKHTSSTPFSCQHCSAAFNDQDLLRRHIKLLHRDKLPKSESYLKMCEFCNMPLYSYAMEAKHECPSEHVSFSEVYDHGKGTGSVQVNRVITGPSQAADRGFLEQEFDTDAMETEDGGAAELDGQNYVYITLDPSLENCCTVCFMQFSTPDELSSHQLLHQEQAE